MCQEQLAVMQLAQRIEGTQVGRQVELPAPGEELGGRLSGLACDLWPDDRIDALEHG